MRFKQNTAGACNQTSSLSKHAALFVYNVALCLYVKTNFSAEPLICYENACHVYVHFHTNQTNFHEKGIAQSLVLKQRHRATQKRSISTHHQRGLSPRSHSTPRYGSNNNCLPSQSKTISRNDCSYTSLLCQWVQDPAGIFCMH